MGRVTQVTGSSTIARDYNDAGLLLAERYTSGPLSGLGLTNRYDQYLRRKGVKKVSVPAIGEKGGLCNPSHRQFHHRSGLQ